jgi:phytoene dehydrogenase-like protein
MAEFDAVVVGAGPNGLSAAIVLARAGLTVVVLEANETIGGGARTAELTLPGFHHDICSAVHPMATISPFFRTLPLAEHGLTWIEPPLPLAHPLDDGSAAVLQRSVEATAAAFGDDGDAYRTLIDPLARRSPALFSEILGPIHLMPRHPFVLARFGLRAIRSADAIVRRFHSEGARALWAGCCAHSFLPLDRAGSASFGLALMLGGHLAGWPVARGGSSAITNALAAYLTTLGGEIRTGHRVSSMSDLPASRAVLFDVTPRQLVHIAVDDLPPRYLRRLSRFRYGPGVFKVDWALDGPIPWRASDCARASTVHLGGTFEEVARHEAALWRGRATDRPFVLVAQQSAFDSTRAPAGKHTAWAYCHVPNGSTEDMTAAIESQVERFAPGFRARILARHTMNTAQFEAHDANIIGGDIGGGANNLSQFLARPVAALDPYATPNRRLFLCSSSTPPGGGVHGMCGYWAAQSALRNRFGIRARSTTD